MSDGTKKWLRDAAERVFWTAVSALLAFATVKLTDLPEAWIPVATIILTTVKTVVAKHIGDPDSAAITKPNTPAPAEEG